MAYQDLWTAEAALATDVMLLVFRANGQLVAAGDVLAAPDELSSARWQVLGAVAQAEQPLTVPQVARRMGLTRQSVRSTVKRLVEDGLLEQAPNLDHRRAHLLRLTELGTSRLEAVNERQAHWANRLSDGFSEQDLKTTVTVLTELCARLERDAAAPSKQTSPVHR